MKYYDESRPETSAGHRAYISPEGRPIGPLPVLEFRPTHDGRWDISVMLLINPTTGRDFSIQRPGNEIEAFLTSWREDPEKVLREDFGYTGLRPSPAIIPPARPKVTLASLGLGKKTL